MRTPTLCSLKHYGLITRTTTPTVSVTVACELTDLRLSLTQMMCGLKSWAAIDRLCGVQFRRQDTIRTCQMKT
ncbi:hypothetical protein GCM10027022_08950 [Alpinimonas psychrophila]|uniref:DNA-binding HxlR family transcriptional regulator n=1 Tax=Alpinimonas psychrophila TaxID=748908 RepID=A0A7W3JT38_9MICO|nr:DNA-binding HxlR family transcriptional regulator [Alpinimonas psychrophila]